VTLVQFVSLLQQHMMGAKLRDPSRPGRAQAIEQLLRPVA
jgi:hypothetical protein